MISTSTPGSMVMLVMVFTASEGACRSMMRLWMRIWKRSHELVPSPQGVLRVVILRIFVGRRTGPATLSLWDSLLKSRARFLSVAHTVIRQDEAHIREHQIEASQ